MILVTGHRGFVGSHLTSRLKDWVGVDLVEGRDILSAELPEVDRVYHLAANTDAQSPETVRDAEVNILGTLRLLERYGSRVVFASSSMINYPVTPYGISKLAGEHYARLYGAAVVRFCNLYGEGGHSAIDRFRDASEIQIRGTGEQVRTYAPVEHAVSALLEAKPGKTYVLSGTDFTVNDIAGMSDKPVRRVPASPLDLLDARQVLGAG